MTLAAGITTTRAAAGAWMVVAAESSQAAAFTAAAVVGQVVPKAMATSISGAAVAMALSGSGAAAVMVASGGGVAAVRGGDGTMMTTSHCHPAGSDGGATATASVLTAGSPQSLAPRAPRRLCLACSLLHAC